MLQHSSEMSGRKRFGEIGVGEKKYQTSNKHPASCKQSDAVKFGPERLGSDGEDFGAEYGPGGITLG